MKLGTQAGKVFLALFVGLTVLFAAVSVWEYYEMGILQVTPTNYSTITTTTVTASQTQSSGSNPFPDNGYIQIGSVGYFHYTRIPVSGGAPAASTTIESVTFSYLKPNATITGCIQYEFRATFQGGSSENLTAQSCPTNFETDVVFSSHTSHFDTTSPTTAPTAGLILIPSGGPYIYALASI